MLWIKAPHFTAGVILDEEDRVVETAPILHWMNGWFKESVLAHCKRKQYAVEER